LFSIDLQSRHSVREQIVEKLQQLIITGVLTSNEKLPGVQKLSETMSVSPTTLQKAIRELEAQGFIYTSPGLGTFVAPPEARSHSPDRTAYAQLLLRKAISALIDAGLDETHLLQQTSQIFKELTPNGN
jgi:GntR family transcriptional regulator